MFNGRVYYTMAVSGTRYRDPEEVEERAPPVKKNNDTTFSQKL